MIGLLSAALLTFAGDGPAMAPAAEPEPAYQGRPLSAWVSDLKSRDPDVRFDAAIAVGRLGPRAGSAVPDLIAMLKDENSEVVYAARLSLGRIGKPAIPPLLIAMKSRDTNLAAGASVALSRIGEPALDPCWRF
jgi:HEAT repeat protein